MLRSETRVLTRPADWSSPAAQALRISAGLLVILSLAGFAALSLPWLPAAVFAVVVLIVCQCTVQHYRHGDFGLCNSVTLLRAAIIAFLLGALFDPAFSVWLFFALSSVAFALDGFDGWLARRSGLVSSFGARFDMETDAALAAVLALWILMGGTTGPDILVLGFARYVFVVAALALPALQRELPQAFRRKAICVFQIGTLMALVLPVTPPWIAPPLSALAAVLVLMSFAVDTVWLVRRSK
ncbi:MAG: CDP-alcohol phosphatidyltransferase family protein [Pseudomonadota bacterium]